MSATIEQYEKKATLIKLEDVCLSLGNRVILNRVNAEVKDIVRPGMVQGQIVGLLGPSGIGKSQLSRIIAGLQKPSAGTVFVGEPGVQVRKGMVGMVDQGYVLFDWATVLENLLIAGKQAGLTHDASMKKIAALAIEFQVSSYLKLYPKQLSGGTRQRVAILQQVICSEHFMVLDEPFSGLDMITKRRACDFVRKIGSMDELSTIIVVTHNIAEAASIADTIWLLGEAQDTDGKYIGGANIVETYDLAALGLCWHPELTDSVEFRDFVHDVEKRFETLKRTE